MEVVIIPFFVKKHSSHYHAFAKHPSGISRNAKSTNNKKIPEAKHEMKFHLFEKENEVFLLQRNFLYSSVARGAKGGGRPPISAKDEFCDSSKSVEKLKGGGEVSCILLQDLWQYGLSMLGKKQE